MKEQIVLLSAGVIIGIFAVVQFNTTSRNSENWSSQHSPKAIKEIPMAAAEAPPVQPVKVEALGSSSGETASRKVQDLTTDQLEEAIQKIDVEIIDNKYVDKANRGTISMAERDHFRTLLKMRDKLFEEKVAKLLEQS